MFTLTDDEKPKFDRLVEDAMRAFGYSRARAETMALKMVERFRKLGYFAGDSRAGGDYRGARAAQAPAPPPPTQSGHRPMTATEKAYYDRLVVDGMKRRHCRSKAERLARMAVKRFRKTGVMEEPKAIIPKKPRTPVKMTRAEIAKLPQAIPPRRPPRNAKERIERALGPDEGERRRRGGSPVLQGGSPGLGRRR